MIKRGDSGRAWGGSGAMVRLELGASATACPTSGVLRAMDEPRTCSDTQQCDSEGGRSV